MAIKILKLHKCYQNAVYSKSQDRLFFFERSTLKIKIE